MLKGIDFLPRGTKFPFMGFRTLSLPISALLVLASLGLFFTQGLNFGIDFLGGSVIEVKSRTGKVDVADLRSKVGDLGLGEVQIQGISELIEGRECFGDKCAMIRVQEQPGGEQAQQAIVTKVKQALGDTVEYRRTEVVGPTVSEELKRSGTIAVLSAIIAVLLYIWFRFEWQFSVAAVAALVHDVVVTIGVFSLMQLEFGLSIIAALLTIVGYSLNDTVVVFDRIRENLRKFKKMELEQLLNLSINETLSRTILTSVTTLIALITLYIFMTDVIRGFIFAMMWGVVIGTYSSIFVAAPILNILGVSRDWSGLGGAKYKEPATN